MSPRETLSSDGQTVNLARHIASAPVDDQVIPRMYTIDEVEEHATPGDCWLIVHGKVYDVTSFVPSHPGGNMIWGAIRLISPNEDPRRTRQILHW